MAKLAIFDLDGTLLDTVEDLGNACNFALKNCGLPTRPISDYYQLVGRGIYNLFRSAVQPRDPQTTPLPESTVEEYVPRMASFFIPYYEEHKCDCTKPYPGINEMLRTLSEKGVMIALASNKYQEGVEKLARHFFGGISFLKILGQREGQPIKPDLAIVAQVMAQAPQLTKEDVVYIGDSNVDMQTGANAGVKTIGVTWGFRSREELEACSPYAVLDTAQELTAEILR
jgi:haloacid dehalogenase superfamily, subfamily IA, variant 1 with third motif having Dx(3-4)D or Dx(3-4)E